MPRLLYILKQFSMLKSLTKKRKQILQKQLLVYLGGNFGDNQIFGDFSLS